MNTRVLTASDVHRVIRRHGAHAFMDDLIALLDRALREFHPSHLEVPARSGFEYLRPNHGLVEWMPVLRQGDCVLLKTVGYHPANPSRHALPSVLSILCRFDVATGHLTAMTDGTLLTAIRTGAASAIASRVLAPRNTRCLGLIGCGTQAVTQWHALSRILPLEEILVFDISAPAAASFRARIEPLHASGAPVRVAPIDEILARADVLCTATSVAPGAGPVLPDLDVRDGLHINAVGSDFPGKIEVPLRLLKRSLVCPDFLPQALREGECQQLAANEVGPDLVRLAQEPAAFEPWRARTTVFDSTGWALEDLVAMDLLLERAEAFGLGREIEIECHPPDPRHPYGFLEEPAALSLAAQASAAVAVP